jgi:hypothetical protein
MLEAGSILLHFQLQQFKPVFPNDQQPPRKSFRGGGQSSQADNGSHDESITATGTPAGDEIADENPDADANGDSLIGILADLLVNDFRALDRFVADIARDFLSAFQCGGEALAGFVDFFSGHIGRSGHERARIFGERAHVIAGLIFLFVHIFYVY